jgi:hypothetical protein
MRKRPAVGKLIKVVHQWRSRHGVQYCFHNAIVSYHYDDGSIDVALEDGKAVRIGGVWYLKKGDSK